MNNVMEIKILKMTIIKHSSNSNNNTKIFNIYFKIKIIFKTISKLYKIFIFQYLYIIKK